MYHPLFCTMYTNNLTFLQLCLIIQPLVTEMYLVGGCVRDMLIGKQPKDFDLVVNGNLDLIEEELCANGWQIDGAGKQFFVLIATRNGQQFEIAMFRKDGTYTDGRRPDFVEIGTMLDDAMRRDFTINSLYMNPWSGEILDPTCKGIQDIKDKLIRFNGKHVDRIKEDKLRIMRCYRFAKQLGFTIETKALKACRRHFDDMVKEVSSMRIMNEVEKMVGL